MTSGARADGADAQRATPALWQALASSRHAELISMATEATPGDVRAISHMRKSWSAPLVALAMDLARARRTLARKWPDHAPDMLADPPGAEMASSSRAAAHKARRFACAGATDALDLCCGIGGDAMGLIREGVPTTGADLDDTRVWMAGENCGLLASAPQPHSPWQGQTRDVREIDLRGRSALLDPARRSRDGRRSFALADLEPGPDFIAKAARDARAAAIKLAPGVDASELPPGELEIISEKGALTQAVLWTGALARAPRSCALLDRDGATHTLEGEPIERHELAEDAQSAIPIAPIGPWVFSVDPAVERAGLLHLLAGATGLPMVHPLAGLFTADDAIENPWLTPFAVRYRVPWGRVGEKRLKQWLRASDAGPIEVRCRGAIVDADALAKRLRADGSTPYTVLIVRMAGAIEGVIGERTGVRPGKAPPTGEGP